MYNGHYHQPARAHRKSGYYGRANYGSYYNYGYGYGYNYGYAPGVYYPYYAYSVPVYRGYYNSGLNYLGQSDYRLRSFKPMTQPNLAQPNPAQPNVAQPARAPQTMVANPNNAATVISTNQLGEVYQRRAETAFRDGRYAEAARLANEALTVDKHNGLVMLFSAQANFAAGYFDQAVNEIESATNALTSDQWTFVVKNFEQFYGRDDFISQMDKLISRIEQNPRDVNSLILRGFEYAGLGYNEAATNDFHDALLIEPNNTLALRLLRGLTGTPAPIQLKAPVNPTPKKFVPTDDTKSDNATPDSVNTSAKEQSILEGPIINGPSGNPPPKDK